MQVSWSQAEGTWRSMPQSSPTPSSQQRMACSRTSFSRHRPKKMVTEAALRLQTIQTSARIPRKCSSRSLPVRRVVNSQATSLCRNKGRRETSSKIVVEDNIRTQHLKTPTRPNRTVFKRVRIESQFQKRSSMIPSTTGVVTRPCRRCCRTQP